MTLHGPTSSDYDEAISPPLIMTDWGHESAFDALMQGLSHPDVLLNGRGNVINFNTASKSTTPVKAPYHISFDGPVPGRKNKRYLLRIINTSFDTIFVFSINHHELTIVSADFVPILPDKRPVLVGIGQRYNIIVEANTLSHITPRCLRTSSRRQFLDSDLYRSMPLLSGQLQESRYP